MMISEQVTKVEAESLPSDWQTLSFDQSVLDGGIERKASIPQGEYKSVGRFPVVDQGSCLIAGYTNDERAVHQADLPLILFGDHTRIFKFLDFPFATGADGTKVFRANENIIESRFLYYALLHLDIPSRGYNRHFKYVKEKTILAPINRAEQRAIAAVLSKIQAAMQVQEKTVDTLKELKATTMAKLFREGLREEPLRQTEIGEIPVSWEVIQLGMVVRLAQYGLSVRGEQTGQYPILRMNCQEDGLVIFRDLQFVDIDNETFQSFKLQDGDILFNRTNSWELVGRTAIFHGSRDAVFASYLIRLRVDDKSIDPDFLNYYFSLGTVQAALKSLATRGVGQSNISASKLKLFNVPRPSKDEQRDIVVLIDRLSKSVATATQKSDRLKSLFSSMLHLLMTGQVRVNYLKVDTTHADGAKADGRGREVSSASGRN